LKFLFDNNLPPSLARGIGELSQFDPVVEQVIPLKDKFAANAPDVEWLGALTEEGGWIVVSIDRFKKSTAEREMMRRQGLTVFVLDRQWSKPLLGAGRPASAVVAEDHRCGQAHVEDSASGALALQRQEYVRADPGVTQPAR